MVRRRIERGRRPQGDGFEQSQSGTAYWTLSLYIEPDHVAKALQQPPGSYVPPHIFRTAQMRHRPSFALRNAIDPLMNDIADRDTGGEVQEFLFAATKEKPDNLADAAELIREHEDITFRLPAATRWTTEGVTFRSEPAGLDDDRVVRLRRFWMSHNNGALSYHLGFSHYYGQFTDPDKDEPQTGYDPATYYFLSLLQKLGAPKEYALKEEHLEKILARQDVSVFDDNLGIAPLDDITLWQTDGKKGERFWPFVQRRFFEDARALFPRLADEIKGAALADGFEKQLLELIPFIEVPGLKVPRSRFMFMLHDERFFDRLMPLDPETGDTSPRKPMVQDLCYEDYQLKLAERIKAKEKGEVSLDQQYWGWVCNRADEYAGWIKASRGKKPILRPLGGGKFADQAELAAAIRTGKAEMALFDHQGKQLDQYEPVRIPAFEENRTDCLDYLFLAGFNQNIIDFMNQDTSEILDSIDPIYPDSDEQSDERFFVRYANHRGMITYVPRSRSLESGNDYIGTCPYAFLIHAFALHNEFLARTHERKSMLRIDRVQAYIAQQEPEDSDEMRALQDAEQIDKKLPWHERAEIAINRAKLAEFDDYERFRYDNPFRYDTERDVFTRLEELRGTKRKNEALALAVASLEDHASDLQRQFQEAEGKETARRDNRLSVFLGATGIFGAGQMIYWIGEKAAGGADDPPKPIDFLGLESGKETGLAIMKYTEIAMSVSLILFGVALAYVIGETAWRGFRKLSQRLGSK